MSELSRSIRTAASRIASVCGRVERCDEAVVAERTEAVAAALERIDRGACELRLTCPDLEPELVAAAAGPAPKALFEIVSAITGRGDAASRWIDAVGRAAHWGVHVPLCGSRARVFARWQAELGEIEALLAACGAAGDVKPLREVSSITERTFVDMTSIELDPSAEPRYWAHVSIAEHARSGATLGARVGRLVAARLARTPWPEAWRDNGTAALASSGSEVYASFDPRASAGLELAFGSMSTSQAAGVAAALGAGGDFDASAPTREALDARWFSQVTAGLEADGSASLAVFVRVAP